MGRVMDIKLPPSVLEPLIRTYSLMFGVTTEEILKPEGGFECFGDFFARRLRPETRPICADRQAVISPCDGEIVAFGTIDTHGTDYFEVKGDQYSLTQLLGTSELDQQLRGGGYMVTYLHPRDYHRTHLPVDGTVVRVRQVPGTRFPVTDAFGFHVPGLYQKNERTIFEIDLANGAKLAIVMVAAFGVGNIDTSFAPASWRKTPVCRERDFSPPLSVKRGDDLGAFRLGSTVIMVWSQDALRLDDSVGPGRITMGCRIGETLLSSG